MRPATTSDLDQLLEMMGEFYTEVGYPFDSGHAATAFRELLVDGRLGRAWLIEHDGLEAGYIVVTLGYSMEYGGHDAFIDDLFVRPAYRNRGLGSRAVAEARAFCLSLGVRALHLETEQGNGAGLAIYRRTGFASAGRQLFTLRLSK